MEEATTFNKMDELAALIEVYANEGSVMGEDELSALANDIIEVSAEVADMYNNGKIAVLEELGNTLN